MDTERKETPAQTEERKREIVDVDMTLRDTVVIDLTFVTGGGVDGER